MSNKYIIVKVGEKNPEKDYDKPFKFIGFKNDWIINYMKKKHYLFDKSNTIIVWDILEHLSKYRTVNIFDIGAKKIIKKYKPIILFEQNENTITKSMKKILELTEEHIKFNIINYCVKHIGYENFIVLPKENYIFMTNESFKYIDKTLVKFKEKKSIKHGNTVLNILCWIYVSPKYT